MTCADLRRRTAGCAPSQGFFSVERTCPHLPGGGPGRSPIPCTRLRRQRPGPPGEAALAVNIPPGGGGRHPHPSRRRGRGRGAGAPRPGDLYIFVWACGPTASSSATAPTSIVPRAHPHGHRRPGRHHRRCRPSTAPGPSIAIPAGEPRPAHQFRLRGKGMTVLHVPTLGATCSSRSVVETPVHLNAAAEGPAAGVRGRGQGRQARDQPRIGRLLRQGQGALGRPDGLGRAGRGGGRPSIRGAVAAERP